jgi:hypothetical protein
MPEQLGPLEIDCDAPPYTIVQASAQVGIMAPEDVRWCQMSHFRNRTSGWRKVFGLGPKAVDACDCGQPLPELARFVFTFNTGETVGYALGQCPHCHRVFWD